MSLKTREHQPTIQVALLEINRYIIFSMIYNQICCVMVSMLPLSAVDHGFEHQLGATKDIKLVFVASPLIKHY